MKSAVLRATIDLSRLRWLQGRSSKAIDELGAALSPFAEGLDTGDLKAARELLNSMRDNDAGIDAGLQRQI